MTTNDSERIALLIKKQIEGISSFEEAEELSLLIRHMDINESLICLLDKIMSEYDLPGPTDEETYRAWEKLYKRLSISDDHSAAGVTPL
jgi:hypothetical protein